MWSESHFVDVFVHDTKSNCQIDWKVLMCPGVFPFVGKSVYCPQNWKYRGCWILRKTWVPWVPAWPRQSVGYRVCTRSTPPL